MNEDNKNKEDDVKSNQASSVHPTSALQTSSTPSLSLSSLSSISSSHTMPSSSSPSSPPLQPHVLPESQNRNLECCPVSHLNSEYELKEAESMRKTPEKLENAANRPLPEWYFDPSKASIPVTEMIGYPRPSLFTVQKLALNKRKVSDETPGKLSLDLPVASKKPKDDNKGVLDNDQLSSSLSQDNLLSATAISSLLSVKGSANADKKSSSSMDVVGVKQGNTQSESIGRDPKNDLVQKKRKRGGYGRGRTIGEAVRAFVIGDILNLGGDVRTKYVPRGVFTEVASR